jgi:hypothetical protein
VLPSYNNEHNAGPALLSILQQQGQSVLVVNEDTVAFILRALESLNYNKPETQPISWEDVNAAAILRDLASKGWTILPPV